MLGAHLGLLEHAGLEDGETHDLVGNAVEVGHLCMVVEGIAAFDIVLELSLHIQQIGVQLHQEVHGQVVAVPEDGQQQMFGTDVVAMQAVSLLTAIGEYV